jgi:lysozyme family protein
MSQAFELAVDHLMLYEVGKFWNLDMPGAKEGWIDTREHRRACGYTNDPNDPGGITKYGIAANRNPDVDVPNLDWDGARVVYYNHYWVKGHCHKLPGPVAAIHFDGCVNNGYTAAAKFLQRAAGVLDDGGIGPATLSAVNATDPTSLCHLIADEREKYYRAIVANRPKMKIYINGWMNRINDMREFTTNLNNNFG